jgi:hypothetical protein
VPTSWHTDVTRPINAMEAGASSLVARRFAFHLSLIPGLHPFNTSAEADVYPVLGPRGARRLSAMYCGSHIASGAHSLAAVLPPPSRQASWGHRIIVGGLYAREAPETPIWGRRGLAVARFLPSSGLWGIDRGSINPELVAEY